MNTIHIILIAESAIGLLLLVALLRGWGDTRSDDS